MTCQRFALKATNDDWMEWFVYDMGALPQAFSVFSLQRRAEGKTIGLTPFAYQTENALYFVSGRYYVEAVTAMPVPAMMAAMRAMARQFVAAHPPGPSRDTGTGIVSAGKSGGRTTRTCRWRMPSALTGSPMSSPRNTSCPAARPTSKCSPFWK